MTGPANVKAHGTGWVLEQLQGRGLAEQYILCTVQAEREEKQGETKDAAEDGEGEKHFLQV